MIRNREMKSIMVSDLGVVNNELTEKVLDTIGKENIQELLEQNSHFRELMVGYRCAIMEIETKFRVLNEEFSWQNDRNPIESIKTRLKEPLSILNKMQLKEVPLNFESMEKNILDIAGVRVICSFESDVYFLAGCLARQTDIEVIKIKDYIKNPKPTGYRSYHMTVRIPIFFANETKLVPVEIQFRTIAMDFWASLEHNILYKKNLADSEEIADALRDCADASRELDEKMEDLLHLAKEKKSTKDYF